jgi:hypothetical protein
MQKAARILILAPLCGLLIGGCDQLGLETPAQTAAAKEAEGRAVGSACRHSGRALEDCYTLNPKAQKAAVFTGWRDMDAYMRENNIEVVAPTVPRPDPLAAKKKKPAEGEAAAAETKTEPKAEEAPAKKEAAAHSRADTPPIPAGKGKMA